MEEFENMSNLYALDSYAAIKLLCWKKHHSDA